jgi:hypothetical protein
VCVLKEGVEFFKILFTWMLNKVFLWFSSIIPGEIVEFVPKFHFAFHASQAALPMVTSKYHPNVALKR